MEHIRDARWSNLYFTFFVFTDTLTVICTVVLLVFYIELNNVHFADFFENSEKLHLKSAKAQKVGCVFP